MFEHSRSKAMSAPLRVHDDLQPVPIAMHPAGPDNARRDKLTSINGDGRARMGIAPTIRTQLDLTEPERRLIKVFDS
jgi:hypothetical protein